MPERSRMYFLTLETTTRMSSCTESDEVGLGIRLWTRSGSGGCGLGLEAPALVGAIASTAQASRWRSVATWLSQHGTLQNTRRMRARLQVDTLHTQWRAPNGMSLRQ